MGNQSGNNQGAVNVSRRPRKSGLDPRTEQELARIREADKKVLGLLAAVLHEVSRDESEEESES